MSCSPLFNAITACALTIKDETLAAFLDRSSPAPARPLAPKIRLYWRVDSFASSHAWAGSLGEQPLHLVIVDRREVRVVDAHGEERVRRQEADQLVSLGTQRLARRLGGHRDGHDQAGWAGLAHRADRGPHGCPGRQAVVDKDHCPTGQVGRWPSPTQSLLAAAGLGALLVGENAEHPPGHAEFARKRLVHELGAIGRYSSERELWLYGDADLPGNQHIQVDPERARHRRRHGHATARNAHHERVLSTV